MKSLLRIGVISDTHGLLRPEVVERLRGVGHILHAGDMGSETVLEGLRKIAPLTAIRGNVDGTGACAELPPTEMVELGGKLFYLVHSVHDLDIKPEAAAVSVVVSGHSHKVDLKEANGVMYLNPGSVGPRRFSLPVTMAMVTIEDEKIAVGLVTLDV